MVGRLLSGLALMFAVSSLTVGAREAFAAGRIAARADCPSTGNWCSATYPDPDFNCNVCCGGGGLCLA